MTACWRLVATMYELSGYWSDHSLPLHGAGENLPSSPCHSYRGVPLTSWRWIWSHWEAQARAGYVAAPINVQLALVISDCCCWSKTSDCEVKSYGKLAVSVTAVSLKQQRILVKNYDSLLWQNWIWGWSRVATIRADYRLNGLPLHRDGDYLPSSPCHFYKLPPTCRGWSWS